MQRVLVSVLIVAGAMVSSRADADHLILYGDGGIGVAGLIEFGDLEIEHPWHAHTGSALSAGVEVRGDLAIVIDATWINHVHSNSTSYLGLGMVAHPIPRLALRASIGSGHLVLARGEGGDFDYQTVGATIGVGVVVVGNRWGGFELTARAQGLRSMEGKLIPAVFLGLDVRFSICVH